MRAGLALVVLVVAMVAWGWWCLWLGKHAGDWALAAALVVGWLSFLGVAGWLSSSR